MVEDESFRRIGSLDKPPEVLRSAITKLEAHYEIHGPNTGIVSILEGLRLNNPRFASSSMRSDLPDNLFRADYSHVRKRKRVDDDIVDKEERVEEEDEEDSALCCQNCDQTKIIERNPRKTEIEIHYSVVASGNSVIKDAKQRDEINKQQIGEHALCFEMEAAGIANSHPCLVIRGICGRS
jgi:nucleoside phosphorylase